MNGTAMTLSRKLSLWALPALLAWTPACGTTATTPTDATTLPTPTPTPATSTVTVTVDPTTITATASSDQGYTWTGSFVATVNNTNTSPITLRAITADLQQSSGGVVITPVVGTDEAFRFNVRAPGNRIDVNSTMAIPFTFFYTLPNGGREAIVSLAFSVTTDAGGSGSVTATANFQ
jgi:hypothetical protein